MGNIYTVKCSNVQVHLDPPFEQVLPLDLPSKEEIWQFVSEYKEGKMVTNMVVRGEPQHLLGGEGKRMKVDNGLGQGTCLQSPCLLIEGAGYPTTAEKKEQADKKQEMRKSQDLH